MKNAIVPGYVVALLLIGFTGCDKKSGEAVVLAKRYATEDAARLVNGILGRIDREAEA